MLGTLICAIFGTVIISWSPKIVSNILDEKRRLTAMDGLTCWDQIPALAYFILLGIFYFPVLILTSMFHIKIWNIRNGKNEKILIGNIIYILLLELESTIKRSTSKIKGPRNVLKLGSLDSAGSKIVSKFLFLNSQKFFLKK